MEAVSRRRWVLRRPEPEGEAIDALCSTLSVGSLTARALLLRGVGDEGEGREFLHGLLAGLPDPLLMSGMEPAVKRLAQAIEVGERIAVHGDYDVDGITGTALLVETLCAFGAKVAYSIPLRLKDGYGLAAEALEAASAAESRVVVTVDCGISAIAEARLARTLGLDLIITDHHQPPAVLPEALAIINPHQAGCKFPFKDLAGVGVAFFLLVALRKELRDRGAFISRPEPDLRHALDLVALGSIADIVPLSGVNRLLARIGLSVLEAGSRPGVRALKEVADVKEVNCGAVGFRLAPRLNAAGRLEDAALGVELLLESSDARAMEIARQLDQCNRTRQAIEQQVQLQAIEKLRQGENRGVHSIVLADERWHPGVIGIVASRLVERYHRPTVLIALENGKGKGSARSIRGFHLHEALQRCRNHLEGFGGHEFAAGLSIDSRSVTAFAEEFEKVALDVLTEEDLLPRLGHDGEVTLEELKRTVVEELAALAPFGAGNPEPAFVASAARVQQVQVVGRDHLRFTARQGGYSLPCIAFGMAERREDLAGELDLLFSPSLNSWKGEVSVQLRIRDFRPAGEG